MQINTLKIKTPRKKRKTIGRGGKKGTYSGRGGKGQTARSGSSINPLFEGGRSSLIDRLKKLRGFKSKKPKAFPIDLARLEKKFEDGAEITRAALVKSGLLTKAQINDKIKILGAAAIKKKFKIEQGIMLSAASKKSIEASGGQIQA